MAIGLLGDNQIFNDFSLVIPKGNVVAILGASGSGKTTLINLLLKYNVRFGGKITYFIKELKEIDEDQLFGNVYLVPQQSFIFKSTLRDNITMFSQGEAADSQRYREVLNDVNLSQFLAQHGQEALHPDTMSGGVKKWVSIPRALYQDTKIIILDEPTSDLDPENKKIINSIIFGMKDKTRIVITHDWDPNYLAQFDQVIHLGDGSGASEKEKDASDGEG